MSRYIEFYRYTFKSVNELTQSKQVNYNLTVCFDHSKAIILIKCLRTDRQTNLHACLRDSFVIKSATIHKWAPAT